MVTELPQVRTGSDVRRFVVVRECTVTVAPRGHGRVWDMRPEVTCSCGADMCPDKMAVLGKLASETHHQPAA